MHNQILMKNVRAWIALILISLSVASCSKDDVVTSGSDSPTPAKLGEAVVDEKSGNQMATPEKPSAD